MSPDPPTPASLDPQWFDTVVETHISTLLFTGDRVFKRKKPVRFPFVDFSTVERRRWACEREVQLNRRFSPDVYLGVVDLPDDDGHLEPVVVMRRMDPRRRLATLVAEHSPHAHSCLEALAKLMADFHRRAPRSPAISGDGSLSGIAAVWDESFEELRRAGPTLVDPDGVNEAQERAHKYLRGRQRLFDRRVSDERICDGHGDLQADDVFCTPEGPRVLDCLEFDDRLRHVDVLADVAFLAMDLERLGAPEAAGSFVTAWAEALGDPGVVHNTLMHHYVARYALVRGKVNCLRASQTTDPEVVAVAGARADALLDLALAHLRVGAVRLVLVGGLPGVGKTTLARALADVTGWPVLRSDAVRRQLAGFPPDVEPPPEVRERLYAPAAVAAVYAELRHRARELLRNGFSVILDASWTSLTEREAARALAVSCDADLMSIQCVCDPQVAHRRIRERVEKQTTGGSDATVEVAELLALRQEPWRGSLAVDTGAHAPSDLVAQVLEASGGGSVSGVVWDWSAPGLSSR